MSLRDMICERCFAKPPAGSAGDLPHLHDYCARCSKNLCARCMKNGCCRKRPAESGQAVAAENDTTCPECFRMIGHARGCPVRTQKTTKESNVTKTKQKRLAYTAVIDEKGQHRLGIATDGEAGYNKVREDSDAGGTFATREAANACADAYNEGLGLTKEEALEIVLSSMRGTGKRKT